MKKIYNLLILFLIGICLSSNVYALKIAEAGDTVVSEGNFDSSRFIAGNNITDKSTVDGLSLIAGNSISTLGDTQYGIYAGNNITVSGKIEKDLFVAGNRIVITDDATIERDVYIAGNYVDINADINRNLRVGGSSVDIKGITIEGNAYIYSENITLDETTTINGTLKYSEDSKIMGLDKANVEKVTVTKSTSLDIDKKEIKEQKITNIIINIVTSYVTILVILLLIPKIKDKLNRLDLTSQEVVKTMLVGLSIMIVIPVAALITVFTGILTPLSLILLAIYFICLYLSTLFTSYVVGRRINKALFKKDNLYLSLLIGIVLYKLIKLVPTLGGFVVLFFTIYGLGIIYKYIVSIKK